MAKPVKIIWSEGMVLSQQHFQQWTHFYDYYLLWLSRLNNPFHYGLVTLEINTEALHSGCFQLRHCQAMYRSGDFVDIDEDQALSCAIKYPGPVYLCLARHESLAQLTGYPAPNPPVKYQAQYLMQADCYDTEKQTEIAVAKAACFLQQEVVDPVKFQAIQIADIQQKANGDYVLNADFMPSCMQAGRFAVFKQFVAAIKQELEQAYTQMVNAGENIMTLVPVMLRYFISELTQLEESELYRPWQLYCCIKNYLVSVGANVLKTRLAKYNHQQLTVLFRELRQQVTQVTQALLPKKQQIIQFEREQGLLVADFDYLANAEKPMAVYLVVSATHLDEDSAKRFCQQIKIASLNTIQIVMHSALPGVRLQWEQRVQAQHQADFYFRFVPEGEYWQHILADKTLALFVANAFSSCDIHCLIQEE